MRNLIFLTVLALSFIGVGVIAAPDGKALFDSKCAACHGAEGGGTGMLAPLNGSDFIKNSPTDDIVKIILEGTSKGAIPMPATKVTEEEAKAIADYLKGLK